MGDVIQAAEVLLITVGASEAVDLALRATCDPGDEVILHEPSYVAYVPAVVFAGGTVVHVPTRFEDDFALDPSDVEAAITPRTKALFLGYPANPTGAVLDDAVQDELARIAVEHDLLVYSDEIYDRLAYGTYRHRAFSALPGMRDRTILMGGFSKAYAMTGWRVGWMIGPADAMKAAINFQSHATSNVANVAQAAALAAVSGDLSAVAMMREAFARLADAASEALGWDPSTLILDWLEGELRTLRAAGQPHGPMGSQPMSAAVALAKALRQ